MSTSSDTSTTGGVPLPASPPPPGPASISPPPPPPPPLTHFLSLPLHHAPQLQEALDALARDVKVKVPAGAWRPTKCCHLTLGVMALPTPEMVAQAGEVLGSLDLEGILREASSQPSSASPEPLRIALKGLATMGSPKAASVLYIPPVDATDRILRFAEAVRRVFVDAGLMEDEKRALKLHATVLNTVYAKGKKSGGRWNGKRRVTVDLRQVLQEFGDAVFVDELEVERIVICRMGAKDEGKVKGGGGYEEVFARRIL